MRWWMGRCGVGGCGRMGGIRPRSCVCKEDCSGCTETQNYGKLENVVDLKGGGGGK